MLVPFAPRVVCPTTWETQLLASDAFQSSCKERKWIVRDNVCVRMLWVCYGALAVGWTGGWLAAGAGQAVEICVESVELFVLTSLGVDCF